MTFHEYLILELIICHAGLGDCVVIGKNVILNKCEES
jgi:hypothetical protein